ncbi:uncharacterized protein [Oscarella lobularis]|uniref:uncharacterized protein isoform X2 n=1 Tax=Oscarella lobularis TaxID=121494 RepID=UPI003313A69B
MKRFTLILSKFDLNRSLLCPPYPQRVSPKPGSFVSFQKRFSVSMNFSEDVYLQNSAGKTVSIEKKISERTLKSKKMYGEKASSVLLQLVFRRKSNVHKLGRYRILTIYNDEKFSKFRLIAEGGSRLIFVWEFYQSTIRWLRKKMKDIELVTIDMVDNFVHSISTKVPMMAKTIGYWYVQRRKSIRQVGLCGLRSKMKVLRKYHPFYFQCASNANTAISTKDLTKQKLRVTAKFVWQKDALSKKLIAEATLFIFGSKGKAFYDINLQTVTINGKNYTTNMRFSLAIKSNEMIVTALVKYFFIRDQKETYSRLPRRKKFTKNLNLESVNVKDHKFGCIYLPYNSKTSSFKIKKSLKQQVKLLPNPNNFRVKPYRGRVKSSTFHLAAKYKTLDGFIVENHTNRIIGRATLYTTIMHRLGKTNPLHYCGIAQILLEKSGKKFGYVHVSAAWQVENVTDLKCQPCTSRMLFCPECTRPLYHYIQHGKRNAHIGFLPIRHFKIKRNLYVAAIIKGKKIDITHRLRDKNFRNNPTYITKAIIFPRILVIPHPKPFKEKRWFKFFVRHKHATYPKTKYYLKDKCGGFFVSNKVFRQRTTCSDIIGSCVKETLLFSYSKHEPPYKDERLRSDAKRNGVKESSQIRLRILRKGMALMNLRFRQLQPTQLVGFRLKDIKLLEPYIYFNLDDWLSVEENVLKKGEKELPDPCLVWQFNSSKRAPSQASVKVQLANTGEGEGIFVARANCPAFLPHVKTYKLSLPPGSSKKFSFQLHSIHLKSFSKSGKTMGTCRIKISSYSGSFLPPCELKDKEPDLKIAVKNVVLPSSKTSLTKKIETTFKKNLIEILQFVVTLNSGQLQAIAKIQLVCNNHISCVSLKNFDQPNRTLELFPHLSQPKVHPEIVACFSTAATNGKRQCFVEVWARRPHYLCNNLQLILSEKLQLSGNVNLLNKSYGRWRNKSGEKSLIGVGIVGAIILVSCSVLLFKITKRIRSTQKIKKHLFKATELIAKDKERLKNLWRKTTSYLFNSPQGPYFHLDGFALSQKLLECSKKSPTLNGNLVRKGHTISVTVPRVHTVFFELGEESIKVWAAAKTGVYKLGNPSASYAEGFDGFLTSAREKIETQKRAASR